MAGQRLWVGVAIMAFALILFGSAQEKVNLEPVLGKWNVEIDADGQYFYLTMELKDVSGKLEGTISESQGMFTDLELVNESFDGTTLSFEFTSPTPPDGMERLIKAELQLLEGKLDGSMNVPALGMSVRVTATR